jgi:hypothetical protein
VDYPSDDVPKSVPNEESVTSAANKDDVVNSKTPHSDVMDAAAPSSKGYFEGLVYIFVTFQGPGGVKYMIFSEVCIAV